MAFNLQNFGKINVSDNSDVQFNYSTGLGVSGGTFNMFSYYSSTDTIATIMAANYFSSVVMQLSPGDIIKIVATDGTGEFLVSSVNVSGAITLMSTGVPCISNVTLTSAQVLALFGTPQTLVAAVSGFVIVPSQFDIILNYNSVAYTNVGNGTLTMSVGANAIVTLTAAQTLATFNGAASKDTPIIPIVNNGQGYPGEQLLPNTDLTMSMGTANIAAGNSTVTVSTTYRLVSCPAA